MTEQTPTCPACGMPISPEDRYCKRCGADLRKPAVASAPAPTPSESVPSEIWPPTPPAPPPYERKYGMLSRLIRVLYKPSEAMKDIALAPDYAGVIVVMVAQVVMGFLGVAFSLSKISVTGSSAGLVYGVVSTALVLVFALSFILFPVKWLVKSALVWKLGDAGSGWNFKCAASVTGYAYMANLILSLISLPILVYFFPMVSIDTSNIEVARQSLANYQSQLVALKFTFTIPSLFLALLWKSYLGALGTNFGTKQMCKISGAFVIFFLLGLISVAISLLT